MSKCPELKKLPKALNFKSVNFRSQTPGSICHLLAPYWPPPTILDPSHPAVSLPRKAFKKVRFDAFHVVAYPMALLSPPERLWEFMRPFDTWKDRIGRMNIDNSLEKSKIPEPLLNNQKPGRVPMSFVSSASKKISKKRVVRLKLTSQLKTAINFIVARGADTVEDADWKKKLVLNEQEAAEKGDKWILRGWTYIFHPNLLLYRMPLDDLVPLVRKALLSIWDHGMEMEKQWEDQVLHGGVSSVQKFRATPIGKAPPLQTANLPPRRTTSSRQFENH